MDAMRAWLRIFGLATLLVPERARADDFLDDRKVESNTGMPRRFAARPIITPFRTMELFADLATRRSVPLDPQFIAQVGARHGLYENTELGILLWPILFKNGLEIVGPPSFTLARRFPLGGLELGVYSRAAVPLLVQAWEAEVKLLAQLKLADTLRFDFTPGYVYTELSRPTRHALLLPFMASVQLGDYLRISGIAAFQVGRGPVNYPANTVKAFGLSAEVAYTIPEPAGGALCDIVLAGTLPEVYASYDKPDGIFSAWALTLSGRFFFNFGRSSWENDRFID
jgi:hypothetical protein